MLGKHIGSVLDLCSDHRTTKYLLGDILDNSTGEENVSELLDKLSGPQVSAYSLTDIAKKVRPLRNRSPSGGPLDQSLLKFILSYLFPDSEENSAHPYREDETSSSQTLAEEHYASAKTCPVDSLCWRLCTTLACCLGWAGAGGVAHLLHEFCLEVRYRWENGIPLPGILPGPPDTSASLLHQKLQMLNCCIGRRNINAGKASDTEVEMDRDNDSDTDCEEFFECEDEGSKLAAWEAAEGREGRVGQLRLLNDRDWMYRPLLQEPAPLTEDQLAEQAEILMQLGSDQAGSVVRAKIQSAQLLSDMESFKAANPGGCLADFVRWHSPRDWEEEAGLSARMKAEGNMWTELWEQVIFVRQGCDGVGSMTKISDFDQHTF